MRNELIPKILKEYRKKNNYSVNDVALLLQDYNIHPAPKTIYGWENGQALPAADILLTLCEIYHISDVLSVFGYEAVCSEPITLTPREYAMLKAYRSHPELQHAVDILMDCTPERDG